MSCRIPSIFLLMLLAATLAACGSKGALVMPDQPTASKTKHTPATPAAPTTPTAPASGDGSGPAQ